MGFLTGRKKESHQQYDAKQVPGKGPATARADGAPPWGQELEPNLSCSRNYPRANIRDSVLWEQKAGATSNRASCFKTAGCSLAWNAGTSASSSRPCTQVGAELCRWARGAWPPLSELWCLCRRRSFRVSKRSRTVTAPHTLSLHPWKTSEIYI